MNNNLIAGKRAVKELDALYHNPCKITGRKLSGLVLKMEHAGFLDKRLGNYIFMEINRNDFQELYYYASYLGKQKSNPVKVRLGWVLYAHAARSGYARAQAFLGLTYIMGMGVEQNVREGIAWLRRAKRSGYSAVKDLLKIVLSCEAKHKDLRFCQELLLLLVAYIRKNTDTNLWCTGDQFIVEYLENKRM